jgi:hypothetical protein
LTPAGGASSPDLLFERLGVNNTKVKPTSFESLRRLTLLATIAALISVVLWFTGISLAIISFNHSKVATYSCWNHVISELGFPYASRLTWLFDGMLALASLLLFPTLYAVGAYLRARLGTVAVRFGFVTCLALSALGIFGLKQDFSHGPYVFLPYLKIHLAIANVFFLGWLMTVTLFTVVFYRRWTDPASRLMALVGILSWLLYPIFLIVALHANPMQAALLKDLKDPAFRAVLDSPTSSPILSPWLDSHRPSIWWPAALEWGLAWSIWLWHGVALIFLWGKMWSRAS